MSLTSFLDRKDVKAKFREVFANLPIMAYGEMRAAPLTKNYSLVGTAFDYLLRFYMEWLFPFAQPKYWIADIALLSSVWKSNRSALEQARTIVKTAREQHEKYLQNGEYSDDLLRSCLLLAQIDPVFRAKIIVPNLGEIDGRDIVDLRNLINLITPETFPVERVCLLDPTFGDASLLVGGADVDLVVDNALIDIKTTINPKIGREHFNQVLGYYILYRLGGIDGMPKEHLIDQIGIYSSRFGILNLIPVDEIADDTTFENFSLWFIKRAQQEFGTSFKELKS